MTLRIGTDLVDVPALTRRIERSRNDFIRRFCTAQEIIDSADRPERLAARWAAKEATMKALGWGIGKLDLLDIEVTEHATRPSLVLHRKAITRAADIGIDNWNLSIKYQHHIALALVIGSGVGQHHE